MAVDAPIFNAALKSKYKLDKYILKSQNHIKKIRFSAGSYQDLANWYCSIFTRRTVCKRAAGNTPRTQKQIRNCTNSVVALQDHCRYKATTTNHHIKKKKIRMCPNFCRRYFADKRANRF